MRWPSFFLIPRTRRTVYQCFLVLLPGPCFHQAIHPTIEIETADVGLEVPYLLFACSPYFFHLLERLLNSSSVGHCLQDFLDRGLRVRGKVGAPTVFLLHHYHSNQTARWVPRRQEGFDGLGFLLPVLQTPHLLPALAVTRSLRQVHPLFAVGRLRTSSPLGLRFRHRPQRRILGQPAHHHDARSPGRLEHGPFGIPAID